jgi:hypothetical protein
MHTGTECIIHLNLSGLTVRNVCLNFVELFAHFIITQVLRATVTVSVVGLLRATATVPG